MTALDCRPVGEWRRRPGLVYGSLANDWKRSIPGLATMASRCPGEKAEARRLPSAFHCAGLERKPVEPQHRPISALVVDDEAPARRRLADLLKRDRGVGRILEAENGVAAVTLIQEAKPEIVFLDVQMPGVDGLGVINAIGAERMPLTVFVTAYDRFALQAFESDAIDYLLKPFSDKRYETMMERVKGRLRDVRSRDWGNAGSFGPELLKLVAKRSRPGEIWDWIVVKSRDSTRLLMTEDIDWIQAAGVYVTVHAGGEEFLYRAGLASVASRL